MGRIAEKQRSYSEAADPLLDSFEVCRNHRVTVEGGNGMYGRQSGNNAPAFGHNLVHCLIQTGKCASAVVVCLHLTHGFEHSALLKDMMIKATDGL